MTRPSLIDLCVYIDAALKCANVGRKGWSYTLKAKTLNAFTALLATLELLSFCHCSYVFFFLSKICVT